MPALGSAAFADFVAATNEKVITPPKDIINDACKNTYVMADMLRGKGEDQVVKAGSKLTDRLQLTADDSFGFYDPNEVFDPNLQNTLTKIEVNWRFAKSYWGWTDHEVELNEGDRLVQWKSLRDSRRNGSLVSMYNGMEDQMWATPNQATMEATTQLGGRPYSIRAFITEDGNAPWSGTLMTVDPTVYANWKNQVFQFSYASIDNTLIPAFERAWRGLKFESPDTSEQAFKETKYSKFKIYTNLDGATKYAGLTRGANDRAVMGNKPDLGFAVGDLTYGGIALKYISALDAVGYATGQPRFFWNNFDVLFPVFHSRRYMLEKDPINGGIAQPYTWIVYKDTWYNLFCRSRKRLGIIVPV